MGAMATPAEWELERDGGSSAGPSDHHLRAIVAGVAAPGNNRWRQLKVCHCHRHLCSLPKTTMSTVSGLNSSAISPPPPGRLGLKHRDQAPGRPSGPRAAATAVSA